MDNYIEIYQRDQRKFHHLNKVTIRIRLYLFRKKEKKPNYFHVYSST